MPTLPRHSLPGTKIRFATLTAARNRLPVDGDAEPEVDHQQAPSQFLRPCHTRSRPGYPDGDGTSRLGKRARFSMMKTSRQLI